jgi:hypothetical protein
MFLGNGLIDFQKFVQKCKYFYFLTNFLLLQLHYLLCMLWLRITWYMNVHNFILS